MVRTVVSFTDTIVPDPRRLHTGNTSTRLIAAVTPLICSKVIVIFLYRTYL